MKVFSCRDIVSESFGRPFTCRNKGEALRGFSDEANSKDTAIGSHPSDYALYELGEFNEQTGIISVHDTPKHIGNALDFVQSQD